MKFTILSAEERQVYKTIDDQPYITFFKVKTEKGYEATVEVERKGLSKEQILDAIRKELEGVEGVIKTTQST